MSLEDNADTEREIPETGMGECAVSGFLMQNKKYQKNEPERKWRRI